jgi:hypothetical protein
MKFRKFAFRILLPSIYFVLALLPVIGLIITIAEGPNPFGFLFFVSEPGLRLVDFIDRRLVHLPNLNGWLDMLFVMLVNIVIYFLVGWALDAIINRYRESQSAAV